MTKEMRLESESLFFFRENRKLYYEKRNYVFIKEELNMKKVLLTAISAGIGFIGGMYAMCWANEKVVRDPEKYGRRVLFENDDIKVVSMTEDRNDSDWDMAGVIYKN